MWIRLSVISFCSAAASLATAALAAQNTQPAPVPAPDAKVTAGAQVYATAGCVHCHGAHLQGGKKAPHLWNAGSLPPALIRVRIEHGGGGMPPFGKKLSSQQIEDLVAYLGTQHNKVPSDTLK